MILTDEDIRTACSSADGGVRIDPFDATAVEPASYDLRVGRQAATSSSRKVTNLESDGFVEVKPGDFVIVSTLETIRLDASHVGRFGLTSSHARRGLIRYGGSTDRSGVPWQADHRTHQPVDETDYLGLQGLVFSPSNFTDSKSQLRSRTPVSIRIGLN